jgi:hypothetical protein
MATLDSNKVDKALRSAENYEAQLFAGFKIPTQLIAFRLNLGLDAIVIRFGETPPVRLSSPRPV